MELYRNVKWGGVGVGAVRDFCFGSLANLRQAGKPDCLSEVRYQLTLRARRGGSGCPCKEKDARSGGSCE